MVVSFATWMTPAVGHVRGLIVNYGGRSVIEATAAYRSYDPGLYPDRCMVSGQSPANLGGIVWIRLPDGSWYGPCGIGDAASRYHFYHNVYAIGDILEIPRDILWDQFGETHGVKTEVFFGACPPADSSEAAPYLPALQIDTMEPPIHYDAAPYPAQVKPVACDGDHLRYGGGSE